MSKAPAPVNYSAAILAGGKSTRMGRNKALIEYSGQTFLDRLIDEFSGWKEIIVSQPASFSYQVKEGVVCVSDENENVGPLEGIRRVLMTAQSDHVFICAVDMPNLKSSLAEYMTGFISSDYDCYVIRDEKHFQPLCAVYSKKVLETVEKLISQGKFRLMDLLEAVRTKYITLEHTVFTGKMLANYNTSDQLSELGDRVVFCVSGTKDSGKTWLISRLINEFIKDGCVTGVIKHDGHEYEMDRDGSDTELFYRQGAYYTAIFNDHRFSVNAGIQTDEGRIMEMFPEAQIVICEGLKSSSYPKFVVMRQETYEETEFKPPLIGIGVDSLNLFERYSREDIPVFYLNDPRSIYEHIKKYFCLCG